MAMSPQEAINEMLTIKKKGEEMTDEEKKRLEELNQYLQAQSSGKSGLGSKSKNQMLELEY